MKPVIFVFILTLVTPFTFAQQKKTEKCRVNTAELKKVKYYTGSVHRAGKGVTIGIAVKSSQINKSYLVLLAKRIKEEHCREKELVVVIFDNKSTADNFDTTFKSARDTLRGVYVLDRETGEEYISFVLIPNYFENPDQRIRINF